MRVDKINIAILYYFKYLLERAKSKALFSLIVKTFKLRFFPSIMNLFKPSALLFSAPIK